MALFGNMDGATEGATGFVQFESRWGDIALKSNDRRVRIVVGRRGAGKSRYLRSMERDAAKADSDGLLVFPQRDDSVWISQLRWLHRTYSEEHERIETWRRLWGCAVYASLASHLLHFQPPVGRSVGINDEDRAFLSTFITDNLGGGRVKVAMSVVAVLNHFLNRFQDRSRLDAYLADPVWIEVEERVLRSISTSTPVACDTLDETFSASPAAATDCQVGLLEWMVRKLLDISVSNRIHIVVAVRDTVFAAFIAKEHGNRYNRADMIRCLDWTAEAAEHFLKKKVSLLPPQARVLPNEKDSPVKSWLGFEKLRNDRREGCEEYVSDFIVRHTRFLPRDFIGIGNVLAAYVEGRIDEGLPVEATVVAQLVMDEARKLCDLAIETVADHMMALDSDHGRTIVSNGFRQQTIRAINSVFIPALARERFDKATLTHAEAAFKEALGGWSPQFDWRPVTLGEVLWLHGLIGFEDRNGPEPVVKYFSSTKSLKSHLSGELPAAEHYFLHSALLGGNEITVGAVAPIVESLDPE
jgi:hypothetical protein